MSSQRSDNVSEGCAKPTVATLPQDHLPNWIGLLHQLVDHFAGYKLVDLHRTFLRLYFAERILIDDLPVDGIVHELASELDPFVERRRGHPPGFELLEKLFRMAYGDLVDPDPLGHKSLRFATTCFQTATVAGLRILR